jgi:5-oxopent-3-ene-1,2,5-tricarboxylate decarboxylase/2-hydroxyhepta-2,4-diene-1,7-dioate isomerase
MNDLSIPHASFFRPPVKFKCVDGFWASARRCAMHRRLTRRSSGSRCINGELKHRSIRRRCATPQLLADVGEFMTLAHGDVLMLGCDAGRPPARPGDRIEISARASRPWSTRW